MSSERINIFSLTKRINRPLILDGAMGSLLEQKKLIAKDQLWSAAANLTASDKVLKIHRDYIEAGADIITTNTFRTNPNSLRKSAIRNYKNVIKKAVWLAFQARENNRAVLIAGSNPPAEDCYQAERTITNKQLESNHKNHIDCLFESEVDFILNETQSHFDEIEIICNHCNKNKIPFVVSLFFTKKLKLLSGENVDYVINFINDFNPLAIAFNCIDAASLKKLYSKINPDFNWGFYLNCFKDNFSTGKISCVISPKEYLNQVNLFMRKRPSFIGACCGSNPNHIRLIKQMLNGKFRN
ncbi:MAG: homocysteine S-methyltransferase family protein [Ignavibacteriaceae bacterium]|nr:homocysteine S-methyltransferase family protein [Ignavibacteriaceae bacterium]